MLIKYECEMSEIKLEMSEILLKCKSEIGCAMSERVRLVLEMSESHS